jgi:2-amino-4-hydroxy-6-hydroxymethyldihydropteridine diphosphokinase
MLHSVYLAFGSNLGNRAENIKRALDLLETEGLKPVSIAAPVDTAPQGFRSENRFLNSAAQFTTALSPEEVLQATQKVERLLGRTQKSANGIYHDRTIDIDILFYDDAVISTPELTVPHPRIAERLFVLQPLASIAPGLRHPVSGITVGEMLLAQTSP